MKFELDEKDLRQLVSQVVQQTLTALDWPQGRLTLTEVEAAAACGVGRHVLRDLRLLGKLKHVRLGKKVVYRRSDLIEAFASFKIRLRGSVSRTKE